MPTEEGDELDPESNYDDYDSEYDQEEEEESDKKIITENQMRKNLLLQKRKNLLLREVYRFFERAVRVNFTKSDPDQVTKFIEKCFGLKIPIYLLVLMAEDKTMLQNLVNFEEIFGVGLIPRKQISQ